MPHAVGLALELQQPPMVDDAVDHGRRHLVVAEDGAPPRELEVRGENDGLPLVCLRDHLEQQPRPVGVERKEPQLVYDQEVRLPDLGELPVEPAVVARPPDVHHERGGREEARRPGLLAGERAERLRHVRLARADVTHEHQVLVVAEEGEREQVVPAEPLGPRYLAPLVAVEGLGLGQGAPPQERRAPRGVPAPALRLEVPREVLDLPRGPLLAHSRSTDVAGEQRLPAATTLSASSSVAAMLDCPLERKPS